MKRKQELINEPNLDFTKETLLALGIITLAILAFVILFMGE